MGTSLPFFSYLKENSKESEDFNNLMSSYSLSRKKWTDPDNVPVRQILGEGLKEDEDAVLLVDIGGNVGHDLIRFKEQYSDLPGRLILQDLPSVIEAAKPKLPAGIEAMAHDMFEAQPVKGATLTSTRQLMSAPTANLTDASGARAYYLHEVLHDWPNSACEQILKSIADGMTQGYSKILLHESILPETDAFWEVTALDLLMMGLFCARERPLAMWHEILESVGLKVVNIWTYEKGTESLIEAELA